MLKISVGTPEIVPAPAFEPEDADRLTGLRESEIVVLRELRGILEY